MPIPPIHGPAGPSDKGSKDVQKEFEKQLQEILKLLHQLLSDPNNEALLNKVTLLIDQFIIYYGNNKSALTPQQQEVVQKFIDDFYAGGKPDYNTMFTMYMDVINILYSLGADLMKGPEPLPIGPSHGWIYKNGKINFRELLKRYSALQARLRKQLSGIAGSSVAPPLFLWIQFQVTQMSQIGDSVSNIVQAINQMLATIISSYRPRG